MGRSIIIYGKKRQCKPQSPIQRCIHQAAICKHRTHAFNNSLIFMFVPNPLSFSFASVSNAALA
ncbi:MAG: hypothetical protein PCALPYG88_4390 [uncultured Paraburkholderia sp.]|nr:MAG: hypothetical protein PCALPYG08_4693 [uncultured Paraburkholderia sp.]CAH2929243.1 MAG: hypothetical protein PCALPYG88_4390 [uncultured Paraburkholderia sp.]